MFFLIQNDEIVGSSNTEPDIETLPMNWQVCSGPDMDRELLFFDGASILEKPTRPTEWHVWDQRSHRWVAPTLPEPIQMPNWDGFIDDLAPSILAKVAASPMASLLVARMTRLADRADTWKGESDRLLTCWNAAPPTLSSAERSTLNNLATDKNLPIRINGSNLLTPV